MVLPARLLEKYPQEMTIVLQHQFRDLIADAYAASATATVGYPPVHVDQVLDGTVPPPSPIGHD